MIEKLFDFQPTLHDHQFEIEPLREEHFEGLYKAASDPEVWAGHPAIDRYKLEQFAPYFSGLLASGKALVFKDANSKEIIGTSSFYVPPDQPDGIAIGFTFLIKAKWGGATNRQIKSLMLEHAFKKFRRVYFHIAPTNVRSQNATVKLGAVYLYDAELKLSDKPALWKCYGIEKEKFVKARDRK